MSAAATSVRKIAADPRVRHARETLTRSRVAEPGKVDPARWWGRVEQALESVLAAIDEAEGPVRDMRPPGWYAPPGE